MSDKTIPPGLHEQIRRDREAIAAELPDLEERHARMVEAKQEDTFCGQLRRVIHGSGRLVREIAADAGIPSQHLAEFLEGTRTLRSDVLERILQAVAAEVIVSARNSA
jgi:predicted transcriptional regulator